MQVESKVKEEPLFSLKNFFKPTSKNVQLWGLATKGACIGLIGLAMSLLVSNPTLAISLSLLAIVVGGVAEVVILFTREKPVDTLVQAVVDVAEERVSQDIVAPVTPIVNANINVGE